MPIKKHIFLTGFMGTGKSTVGPLLAGNLGCPFFDCDSFLEKKLGKSLSQIFARKGEPFFRQEETKLIREISTGSHCVVGLGGGAVLSQANREILRRGTWVNLTALPATILKRIGNQKTRPLLGKKATPEKIEALLKSRRPYYDMASRQIETDTLSVDGVVTEIMRVLK